MTSKSNEFREKREQGYDDKTESAGRSRAKSSDINNTNNNNSHKDCPTTLALTLVEAENFANFVPHPFLSVKSKSGDHSTSPPLTTLTEEDKSSDNAENIEATGGEVDKTVMVRTHD